LIWFSSFGGDVNGADFVAGLSLPMMLRIEGMWWTGKMAVWMGTDFY
jgi:uncharacterized membrane protein YfbV (UPF0208 family)